MKPSNSLAIVWLIRARPRGRRVHSGSFGLFGLAPGVVGFFRVRLLHSRTPQRSKGSFALFGNFGHTPAVVGFIRFCLVHSGGGLRR